MDKILSKEISIQNDLLEFINDDAEWDDFLPKLDRYQIIKNKYEFKIFLYMILNISNNHHRNPSFFSKIEKILQYYKSDISQFFSNKETFHIFKSNHWILLFLIENKIISIDEYIYKKLRDFHYFSPELNQFSEQNDTDKTDPITFNENRKKGENENYICQMIREDSVIEFIQFISKTNLSPNARIKPSIFETNSFLINQNPTLIEYSAFYGSIQIFRYLFNRGVEIDSKLYDYAIHSKNPEIIHFLEEQKIRPSKSSIKESIKCNHNEITEYLLDNYSNIFIFSNEFFWKTGIKYYNFKYFPKQLCNNLIFYYLCKSDNYYFIDSLLNIPNVDINELNTPIKTFFFSVTPIHAAAKNENLDIVSLLLKQKNIRINDY